MKMEWMLALLAVFDFFGVCLGYEGIARLRRFQFPPFHDGLATILVALPPPPHWLTLSWNALWGRILIWSCCFLLPIAVYSLYVHKKRQFSATTLMLGWTLASGGAGFWIWIHAMMNAMDLS